MEMAVGKPSRLLWKPGKLGVLAIVICSLFLAGALWLSHDRSQARLGFTVQSTVSGQLQIFFDEDADFSEVMSEWYPVVVG